MMVANMFSDEDYQICNDSQLGTPLAIYRLKPGSTRFLRIIGLLIFLTGLVTLVFILSPAPQAYLDDRFPGLLVSFYALFQGGIFYGLMARRSQSMRVIVCAHGLLQSRKMIIRNKVEVVHWQDMLTINEGLFDEYFITYLDDKKQRTLLTLARDYQNLDELAALIMQHSGEFTHEERKVIQSRPVFAKLPEGEKYRCPCCGYKTLNERGEYEICAVCFWQDDGQDDLDSNINRPLSPNHMSLALGRENYQKFGATQKRGLECVRPPLPEEM